MINIVPLHFNTLVVTSYMQPENIDLAISLYTSGNIDLATSLYLIDHRTAELPMEHPMYSLLLLLLPGHVVHLDVVVVLSSWGPGYKQ